MTVTSLFQAALFGCGLHLHFHRASKGKAKRENDEILRAAFSENVFKRSYFPAEQGAEMLSVLHDKRVAGFQVQQL